MTEDKKLHWFCMSYRGICPQTGKNADASTYNGYPENILTVKRIRTGCEQAGLKPGGVMMATTYCGYMTREEFADGEEE